MGRHDEIQVQIGRLVFFDYGLDALKAAYHAHLVEVGHDRCRAMLEHRFRERPSCQVGAFGMNMAIDEARRNEGTLGIDDFRALADAVVHIAYCGNRLTAYRHAAIIDFARVHVHNATVRNHDVRWLAAACYRKKFLVHVPFLSKNRSCNCIEQCNTRRASFLFKRKKCFPT